MVTLSNPSKSDGSLSLVSLKLHLCWCETEGNGERQISSAVIRVSDFTQTEVFCHLFVLTSLDGQTTRGKTVNQTLLSAASYPHLSSHKLMIGSIFELNSNESMIKFSSWKYSAQESTQNAFLTFKYANNHHCWHKGCAWLFLTNQLLISFFTLYNY